MKPEAVVFDFDGVCIDTETARYRSWERIFALHGCSLPLDEWILNIGTATYVADPLTILEHLTGSSLKRHELVALHKRYEVEIANDMPLQPGFRERLDEALSLGMKCAVASSSSHQWVDGHLCYRGIFDLFTVTVCREDTVHHKPDPEPYLTALRLMHMENRPAVAIEDSPLGIASARAAGLFCIGIPCSMTKSMDLSAANLLVNSLNEISFGELDVSSTNDYFRY